MPRYICKLDDMYFDWSTVVDAPITFGMTLEEYKEYYKSEYGNLSISSGEFDRRMKRVEETGTSSLLDKSIDSVIKGNRAGPKESELTKNQLIEYLRNQKDWSE